MVRRIFLVDDARRGFWSDLESGLWAGWDLVALDAQSLPQGRNLPREFAALITHHAAGDEFYVITDVFFGAEANGGIHLLNLLSEDARLRRGCAYSIQPNTIAFRDPERCHYVPRSEDPAGMVRDIRMMLEHFATGITPARVSWDRTLLALGGALHILRNVASPLRADIEALDATEDLAVVDAIDDDYFAPRDGYLSSEHAFGSDRSLEAHLHRALTAADLPRCVAAQVSQAPAALQALVASLNVPDAPDSIAAYLGLVEARKRDQSPPERKDIGDKLRRVLQGIDQLEALIVAALRATESRTP